MSGEQKPKKRVEEVYKVSGGPPTYTFVYPREFNALVVALRTAGRGAVIEGPSGIGKSTAVQKALDELEIRVVKLSARDPADVEYIELLPALGKLGTVVIDDFHRLAGPLQERLADLLKLLADREDVNSKLVIIGINQAGQSLVRIAPDLANRIDVIKMEAEPPDQLMQVIQLGQAALNVKIDAAREVVDASHGSFYLTQMLCRDLCIEAGVLEEADETPTISVSFNTVRRKAMDRQKARFGDALVTFARGNRFRPGGRAPYLHVLRWLADAPDRSVSLKDQMAKHPEERPSVNQITEKGYLERLVSQQDIAAILHYNPSARVLTLEDPHLKFYLEHIDWEEFIREVGFTKVDFDQAYDVALSFAGEDRFFAEKVRDELEDFGHAVFYDHAEQDRILAENVEDYLRPIYESEARYVVAVLGPKYGEKRWTIFESEAFKPRIDQGEVIPIWSKEVPRSAFDSTRNIGSLSFDPSGDLAAQAKECAGVISKKITG
jgi:hypothetical protein